MVSSHIERLTDTGGCVRVCVCARGQQGCESRSAHENGDSSVGVTSAVEEAEHPTTCNNNKNNQSRSASAANMNHDLRISDCEVYRGQRHKMSFFSI